MTAQTAATLASLLTMVLILSGCANSPTSNPVQDAEPTKIDALKLSEPVLHSCGTPAPREICLKWSVPSTPKGYSIYEFTPSGRHIIWETNNGNDTQHLLTDVSPGLHTYGMMAYYGEHLVETRNGARIAPIWSTMSSPVVEEAYSRLLDDVNNGRMPELPCWPAQDPA